jgi:hypothetical protein
MFPEVLWTIEINSGARAVLTTEGTRKLVWRPLSMSREEFIRLFPVGSVVADQIVRKALRVWR